MPWEGALHQLATVNGGSKEISTSLVVASVAEEQGGGWEEARCRSEN